MSNENPTGQKESELGERKLDKKRRLITEEFSLLNTALAKLEEKVGPVDQSNIDEKAKGILSRIETDWLVSTVLTDRVMGVDSTQTLMQNAEKYPDNISILELKQDNESLGRARSLLAKLNA